MSLRPRTSADQAIIDDYQSRSFPPCGSRDGVNMCIPYIAWTDTQFFQAQSGTTPEEFINAVFDMNASQATGWTPETPEQIKARREELQKSKNLRMYGAIGGGLALAVILYFLVKR